ncbi:MAG: membrane integrity-associated transporter subunit PqiC [Opitutaceae bacterium]|nr:membrane integrity-associated transporter subunit PqiC [Opitutaceae bacterium]
MKSFPLAPFCRLLPAIALVTLAGCSLPSAKPDPTRYYLLSAPAPATAPAAPAATRAVTVGLCRIELPVYLRSPAVVLRPGGTELRYAPEARWGEALGLGITRVLKESLRAQPAVRAVVAYPAPQAPTPDYEVAVSVLACEGLMGPASPRTRFAARWRSGPPHRARRYSLPGFSRARRPSGQKATTPRSPRSWENPWPNWAARSARRWRVDRQVFRIRSRQ